MSETPSNPPPEAPAASGPSALLPIIQTVVLVGVLAVVVMMFLNQKKGAPAPAAAASAEGKTEGGEAKEGEKSEGKEGKEGEKGAAAPTPKAQPGAGPTVRLADFVIHLRNPDADRYARMSFEVEVASDKDKDLLTAHTAQIRDSFIGYLSDRTVEELRGSSGLSNIKNALYKQAQDLAPEAHVRSIYITDFVIQ